MTTPPDYHGQNLRGRSFEREELDGADFTEADLRGADFSGASLVGANFTNAHLGVTPLVGVLLLIAAIAVSIIAGLVVGSFAEMIREEAVSADWRDVFAAGLLAAVALLFFVMVVLKGVSAAFRAFLIAVVVIIVVDFAVVFVMSGEIRYRNAVPLIGILVLIIPAALAGILGRMVGGTFGAWAIGLVAVLGGLAAGHAQGGFAAILVSVLLVVLSKRALKGDARDGPMRYLGHRIVSRRGTSFAGADVTRADFTGTNVIHCDLSTAVRDDAIWPPGHVPYTHSA